MTECPICNNDYKNLDQHVKNMHPEVMQQETSVEEPVARKVAVAKGTTFDTMKKSLEQQNELLLLMFQQQTLSNSLTGQAQPVQNAPQPQSLGQVKEAIELIKSLRSDFPADESQGNDPLIEMGGQLLMQHLANKQVPPPPLQTPTPPWEKEIELPEAPEPNYEEVKEEDGELSEDAPSCTVVNSVPSGISESEQVKLVDPKGTKETKSD